MNERYFTVDQIADMLNMHPKTIQRYIREGKLRANKIGKSWRITGHDLSLFTEREHQIIENISHADKIGKPKDERIKISAVADIEVSGINESMQIINMLNAGLIGKSSEYGNSTMTTQYIPSEYKVRVMLWGTVEFIKVMLDSLSILTNKMEDLYENKTDI